MSTLFWLICGHFVADYPLQSDWIAREKAPRRAREQFILYGDVIWPWVLAAHAATHAVAVALATGSPVLGCLEFAAHSATDYAKCRGWFGFHVDQVLHLVVKLAWLFVQMVVLNA